MMNLCYKYHVGLRDLVHKLIEYRVIKGGHTDEQMGAGNYKTATEEAKDKQHKSNFCDAFLLCF